jgi:hypothetical protein
LRRCGGEEIEKNGTGMLRCGGEKEIEGRSGAGMRRCKVRKQWRGDREEWCRPVIPA